MAKSAPVDQTQVVRTGAAAWQINRVVTLYDNVLEYETVGRVVLDNGLYYSEMAKWLVDGHEWERKGRGWYLLRAAVKSLLDGKTEAKQ